MHLSFLSGDLKFENELEGVKSSIQESKILTNHDAKTDCQSLIIGGSYLNHELIKSQIANDLHGINR